MLRRVSATPPRPAHATARANLARRPDWVLIHAGVTDFVATPAGSRTANTYLNSPFFSFLIQVLQ